MSENSEEQLQTISNLATRRYQDHSIIRRTCELIPNPNPQVLVRFNEAERYSSRALFQVNNLRINQMIDRIVIDETNYLINEINSHSTIRDAQEDLLQSIQDAVTELFTNSFNPISMIVPRRLMMDIHRWNGELNPNQNNFFNELRVGPGGPLNVSMPAQNIEFNQIMILSRNCNIWEFFPGNNNSSLQIGSELTPTEIVFWFREQCRFTNDENDGIISLNLPIEQMI